MRWQTNNCKKNNKEIITAANTTVTVITYCCEAFADGAFKQSCFWLTVFVSEFRQLRLPNVSDADGGHPPIPAMTGYMAITNLKPDWDIPANINITSAISATSIDWGGII